MINSMMNEKIRVKIFGKEYEMDAGGLTPLEASQLANYVDEKMREISENFRIVDTQKLAVLTALNIAYELTQQQSTREMENALTQGEENKIQSMIATLDKALK